LLGSLITLLSSVGFSFASGNKIISFVFSLIALCVTISVGYLKLINRKRQEISYPVAPKLAEIQTPEGIDTENK
jgi:hypothetical protein